MIKLSLFDRDGTPYSEAWVHYTPALHAELLRLRAVCVMNRLVSATAAGAVSGGCRGWPLRDDSAALVLTRGQSVGWQFHLRMRGGATTHPRELDEESPHD